jgi:hypothetical protein
MQSRLSTNHAQQILPAPNTHLVQEQPVARHIAHLTPRPHQGTDVCWLCRVQVLGGLPVAALYPLQVRHKPAAQMRSDAGFMILQVECSEYTCLGGFG